MSNKPTHYAYFVKDINSDNSKWTPIGAVWPHKDGKGFNLKLELIPVDSGTITIREVSEKDQPQEAATEPSAA